MVEFNSVQKKTISEYRDTHNLGYVISDDAIVARILAEMEASGVVYKGFETLTTKNNSNVAPQEKSLFGYGFNIKDDPLIKFSNSTKNEFSLSETYEAINFAQEYLLNTATNAHNNLLAYAHSIGIISTGAIWHGLKVMVNVFDDLLGTDSVTTLREALDSAANDKKEAEKLSNINKKESGMFEFTFEEMRGTKFDVGKVQNFKEKSDKYLYVQACKKQYETLEKGISELKGLLIREEQLERLGQNNINTNKDIKTFDARFIEILSEYCGGDENLKNTLITDISKDITSKKELQQKFMNVLENLRDKAKNIYEQQLEGKNFEEYHSDYTKAYSETFKGKNPEEEINAWVRSQEEKTQLIKVAIIIATTTLTGGSNLLANVSTKLTKKYGPTAAQQIIKFALTIEGTTTGVALDYSNAITSKTGLTKERNAEILKTAAHSLPYAIFGAYISGPLGDRVANALNTSKTVMPNILKTAIAKSSTGAGFAAEVGMDVVFETAISDNDFIEIIKGNVQGEAQGRALNQIMQMIVGGRAHSAAKAAMKNSRLEGYTIKPTSEGEYEVKAPNGEVYKANEADFAQILAKAMDNISAGKVVVEDEIISKSSETDKITKENSTAFYTNNMKKTLSKEVYQKEAKNYIDYLLNSIETDIKTKGLTVPDNIDSFVESINGKIFLLPDGTMIQRQPTNKQVSEINEQGWPSGRVKYPDDEIVFEVIDPEGSSHIIAALTPETCPNAKKIFNYLLTQTPIEGDIHKAQKEFLETKSRSAEHPQPEHKILKQENPENEPKPLSPIEQAKKRLAEQQQIKDSSISDYINETNQSLANFMKENSFSEEEMKNILALTSSKNITFVEDICKNQQLSKESISEIIKQSSNLIRQAINQGVAKEEIAMYRKNLYEFISKLTKDDKLSSAKTISIIEKLNIDNLEFAKLLYENPNFGKNYIGACLARVNKENMSFAIRLNNDNFDPVKMQILLSATNKNNLEIAEKLYKAKEFDIISQVLKATRDSELSADKIDAITINKIKDLNNNIPESLYVYRDGLTDLLIHSPEKYQRIMNSGILEFIDSKSLEPKFLDLLNRNTDFSDAVYDDLINLKNGKSTIVEFPKTTDLETAFAQSKIGDVVEIGDKMYINDGNELFEWQMTKEKFLELFPPVERFMTVQNNTEDCFLISPLSNIMQNPNTRPELYKSFVYDGKDVKVTVKAYEEYGGTHTFENGKLNDSEDSHLIACDGLKMYEEAYANVSFRTTGEINPSLMTREDLFDRISGGRQSRTISEILGYDHASKFIEKFDTVADNLEDSFNKIPSKDPITSKIRWVNPHEIDVIQMNKALDSYDESFPKTPLALDCLGIDKLEVLLKRAANNRDFILEFGGHSDIPEYNIQGTHAHSIVGYNPETKMVKIVNPHNASVVTEVPLETLHGVMKDITYVKVAEDNLSCQKTFHVDTITPSLKEFLKKYPENFNEKYLIRIKEELTSDDIITSQIKVFLQEYIYKIKNTSIEDYDLIYNEISSIIRKITSVTPEQVKNMAKNIYNKAILLRSGVDDWKNKNFIQNGLYSEKDISVRIKGDNSLVSLENKILRELVMEHQEELLKAIQSENVDIAYNHIYDLCGTRICFSLEEEVEILIDIFSEMVKKQDFEPQYIANYRGPGISPILTEEQMQTFINLCNSYGYNVIESRAIYDSGYTGLHANGILKHITPSNASIPIEIQVRPKAINELLDAIHIAYDVFNGKDPLKMLKVEEYNRMKVFVKGFEKINTKGLKDTYYKYQVDFIKASLEKLPLPRIDDPKYGLEGFEYLSLEKILEFKHWQDSCKTK